MEANYTMVDAGSLGFDARKRDIHLQSFRTGRWRDLDLANVSQF